MVLRLRKEKYKLQLEDAGKESLRQKIAELETVIAGGNGKVVKYEDSLVRKLIERITLHDDHFTVGFKSGIGIEVRLQTGPSWSAPSGALFYVRVMENQVGMWYSD